MKIIPYNHTLVKDATNAAEKPSIESNGNVLMPANILLVFERECSLSRPINIPIRIAITNFWITMKNSSGPSTDCGIEKLNCKDFVVS